MNEEQLDPYRKLKFRVKWDGRYVAGFQEVSALRPNTETVKHREGGDNSAHKKLPGRARFEAITLGRGLTHDAEFDEWANLICNLGSAPGAKMSAEDARKDLVIEVYTNAGQLALAYKVCRCWVSEYVSVPDLNADATAIAIETLKLENEGWELA